MGQRMGQVLAHGLILAGSALITSDKPSADGDGFGQTTENGPQSGSKIEAGIDYA